VQLSYAIGIAEPVSVSVWTYGTEVVPNEKIVACVRNLFDLTPAGMIKSLALLQPFYEKTAAYGHFGREGIGFTWELCDKVAAIRDFLDLG
jgi:S-adenosylmethionine synthetase